MEKATHTRDKSIPGEDKLWHAELTTKKTGQIFLKCSKLFLKEVLHIRDGYLRSKNIIPKKVL